MTLDQIGVIIAGVFALFGIFWFFFMKKEQIVSASDSISIIVDGGYKPDTIQLTKGKKTMISFIRKDTNSCLEEVVLADFKIKKYLPLNELVSIDITPEKIGEFPFACSMNMFHGKIIVRE